VSVQRELEYRAIGVNTAVAKLGGHTYEGHLRQTSKEGIVMTSGRMLPVTIRLRRLWGDARGSPGQHGSSE
jgi:hypothetical protein